MSNIVLINVKGHINWINIKLADLYLKYVSNHIVARLNDHVIRKKEDTMLEPYIELDDNDITVCRIDKLGTSPCGDNDKILIWTRRKEGNRYLRIASTHNYIIEVLTRSTRVAYDKFIIPELKKINLSPDELISATTGFTYTIEERFSKNSPLPKEITLKVGSGKSHLMHNHVAGSVSKVLYKAIYGDFKGDKTITLQCQDQTLEWFIEGAYTGIFKFDDSLKDHIDGANLLDYLEVLTKENLGQLLHAELFD